MGTIRMVMLDGLTVADLLALRQGGFFEGAAVQLPSTGGRAGVQLPPAEVQAQTPSAHPPVASTGPTMTVNGRGVRVAGSSADAGYAGAVVVPAGALSAGPVTAAPSAIEPPPELPPEQAALLAEFRAEAAAYRAEKGLPLAQDARSEDGAGIDPTPAPVAHPEAPASISAAGLPSIDQLAACTKLRDVMQLLVEGGMAAGNLAAYLESVRDQVPLLQRISNISERVARTLSVMQQGG